MLMNVIPFLSDLKNNNYKEWFHENKQRYDSARDEFKQLIERLIIDISSYDESVKHLQAKDCLFRINRDIRFSKKKLPTSIILEVLYVKMEETREKQATIFIWNPVILSSEAVYTGHPVQT